MIHTSPDRIGKKCRNSGHAAKDCNELGEVAADNIVHDAGLCHRLDATSNNLKKFRRECRSVAYGQCQGAINRSIKDCGGKSQSLREQSKLQKKCEGMVDSMTDNRHGEEYLDFMYDQYLEDESSGDEYGYNSSEDEYGSSVSGDDSDSSDYYDTW